MTRRTHSTIDTLTADLRETITRMVVDADWPKDFPWEKSDLEPEQYGKGKPRYDDIVLYCHHKGQPVYRSSVGRWAKGLQAFERMRTAAGLAKQITADIKDENASATQKAAAEMITAQVIDLATQEDLDAKSLKHVANAVRDCAAIAIRSDQYIREQLKAKVTEASSEIKQKLDAAGVAKIVQKQIDEVLLGIVKA